MHRKYIVAGIVLTALAVLSVQAQGAEGVPEWDEPPEMATPTDGEGPAGIAGGMEAGGSTSTPPDEPRGADGESYEAGADMDGFSLDAETVAFIAVGIGMLAGASFGKSFITQWKPGA